MRKCTVLWMWWLGVVVFLMLAIAIWLVVGVNASIVANKVESVARMGIVLNDVSLEEIKDGDKEMMYGGNGIKLSKDEYEVLLNDVEIGGRGNSTWGQAKKPYKLKLSGRKNLLGLGKSKKWVLLANYFDDTHLRNELAFEFWNMMNEEIQMEEEPVELYVDGEYEGLYYLTRKIEIAKSMVDLRDMNGVVVELDNLNNKDGECYYSEMGNCLVVKDIVAQDNEKVAMEIFLEKFNAFEESAKEKNWTGLRKVCDIESMVKYFLMAEFSANPDAYVSSYYFYLDGANDQLHAGPAWDYDFAFANERWAWEKSVDDSPYMSLPRKKSAFGYYYYDYDEKELKEMKPNLRLSRMFYWMIEIPEFREMIKNEIDNCLMGKRSVLINKIIKRAEQIREVAIIDNEKWERKDYNEEVKKLLWWVFQRYDFIEREYGADLF